MLAHYFCGKHSHWFWFLCLLFCCTQQTDRKTNGQDR